MLETTPAVRRLAIALVLPWTFACATLGPMDARPVASEGLLAEQGFARPKSNASAAATAVPIVVQNDSRKMVYSAALSLAAAKPEAVIDTVIARAEEAGGYLATRNNMSVAVRVPVAKFQELLAEFRKLGRIVDESVQAADVTREHRDLTIRLANAKKTRERLLALLEKAAAVQDILAIEKELARLTTEIEQMQAEIEALDKKIAFSTIAVTVLPVANAVRGTREPSRFGWINNVGASYVIRRF